MDPPTPDVNVQPTPVCPTPVWPTPADHYVPYYPHPMYPPKYHHVHPPVMNQGHWGTHAGELNMLQGFSTMPTPLTLILLILWEWEMYCNWIKVF